MMDDAPELAVDMADLPPSLLADMIAAAEVYRACRHRLIDDGRTILEEVAGDSPEFFTHYPKGDVYDPVTASQYYLHLHRPGEYGHFHTFLRSGGMPHGVEPDRRFPPSGDDPVCHLIAIGLDRRSEPGELFTTNRWVTAESWYRADDVVAMLPRFQIAHSHPSALANAWVGAVMTLFRPQIERLLAARDRRVERHRRLVGAGGVLESRDLEVTSRLSVDIDTQIAALQQVKDEPVIGG